MLAFKLFTVSARISMWLAKRIKLRDLKRFWMVHRLELNAERRAVLEAKEALVNRMRYCTEDQHLSYG